MSEDLADKPFRDASSKVEDSHAAAVEDAKSKVQKAKASALKKVSA